VLFIVNVTKLDAFNVVPARPFKLINALCKREELALIELASLREPRRAMEMQQQEGKALSITLLNPLRRGYFERLFLVNSY